MKHWKVGNVTGLKADGLKAQEDLQNLLKKFQKLTDLQVCLCSHSFKLLSVETHMSIRCSTWLLLAFST
jgi:hypothetical protein